MDRETLTRKYFSKLHTHLIIAVYVPDRALCEGEVLIVCDQSAECTRCDLVGKDRGGGPVAQEDLMRDEILGGPFLLHRLWGFTDHECFGLREKVGGKHSGRPSVSKVL